MNKYILEQLGKAKVKLPPYTKDSLKLIIQKNNGKVEKGDLLIGRSYDVYLENYVIHVPANFTLSANWNRGTTPPENRVKVRILQISGGMVRVDAVGVSTMTTWTGWLPRKSITILGEE